MFDSLKIAEHPMQILYKTYNDPYATFDTHYAIPPLYLFPTTR